MFNVLNDGTIIDSNGIAIGSVTIQSSKYRDDIVQAITMPYTVEFYHDIVQACKDMTADSIHESLAHIKDRLSAYPEETIDRLAGMIESIDYYN